MGLTPLVISRPLTPYYSVLGIPNHLLRASSGRAISRQLHPRTTRGTLNVSKRFRTQQTADSTCCFICGRDEAKTHGQSTMKKQVARTHKEAPLARKDKSNWQRKSYEPIDDSDAGDLIQVCPERNRLTLGSAAAAAAPNDCLIGCSCN